MQHTISAHNLHGSYKLMLEETPSCLEITDDIAILIPSLKTEQGTTALSSISRHQKASCDCIQNANTVETGQQQAHKKRESLLVHVAIKTSALVALRTITSTTVGLGATPAPNVFTATSQGLVTHRHAMLVACIYVIIASQDTDATTHHAGPQK